MDWYVCGMPKVTKNHRLSVARAWFDLREIHSSFHGWIEGEPGEWPVYRESFERLAQLVANAEGARPAKLSEYIRQNAVAIDEFAGSRPKLLGLVVYLLQLVEATTAAPKPPEQP